jgi:glutathione-regulated potassium-efflux system ancillary protein KefC
MHSDELLTAAVLLLGTSAAALLVSRRAGFGSILGLLAAGILLGPHTPGPVVDIGQLRSATELGIVFLLFVIGLELEPPRLWAMRRMLFGLGSLQMVVTGAALMMVALARGWPWQSSLVLGLGLALSSTAFVAQLLAERRELASEHGSTSLAILLLQDMAIVPVIAFVPLLGPGGGDTNSVSLVGRVALTLAALTAVGVLGQIVLPRLLARAASHRNMEAFAVLAILAVMLAAWVTHWAGLSPALGGFMMGVLLSRSSFRHQIAAEIAPYEGLLLGLFFISVGMSIDLGLFLASWASILLLVATLIAVKGAVLFVLCRLFGLGTPSALRTSLLMTQGGEFGFILFGEAVASGVIGAQLHTTALLVISVSMAATPLLARLADRLAPDAGSSEPPGTSLPTELADHVLVAGYGRVGQAVSTMLEQAGVSCLALDLDPDQIAAGRAVGRRVIYGDAGEPHLLEQVGAGRAAALVVALGQPNATERVVRAARSLYPTLPIIARARDLAGRDLLERLGVQEVMLETLALSIELGEATLTRIGVDEAVRRDAAAAVRQ